MMASSTTITTTTVFPPADKVRPSFARTLRRPVATASTPDLSSAFAAHSRLVPRGPTRQPSIAALTSKSLAIIPDVSESYAFDSVLSHSPPNMAPSTPAKSDSLDLAVGDDVDVPGGLQGTVRFVGSVDGKKGLFAGIELHPDYAARGKNNGDVDGVSYFTTTIPGAGIFVPVAKAVRRTGPIGIAISSLPLTPKPNSGAGFRNMSQPSNLTPPTVSRPKFSASVGPGARAPSPRGKQARTSLPRVESPVRRTQMTPVPRPSIGTPAKITSKLGSPNNRLAQSVRGTAGDPSKKVINAGRKPSLGPRSASAFGSAPEGDDDLGSGQLRQARSASTHGGSNSSTGNSKAGQPLSRLTAAKEEELDQLRLQLEDRDRQLKEQATTLVSMESSLLELQSLIEHPDGPQMRNNAGGDQEVAQLRHLLREKNEKIAMLTAEFDAHRADFRSTIDTLEMASTETERVYEKRIEELMGELREMESRSLDVETVASQLKQLEELVQELEEGLEDARRGEAEARGEAEFLRGEVERTRAELRRERERAGSKSSSHRDSASSLKELEQKEDEIRGLKAIIHSLSRDPAPPGEDDRSPIKRTGRFAVGEGTSKKEKMTRDSLERQVGELQAELAKKARRQEELEGELEKFRAGGLGTPVSTSAAQRSSFRDSRDTVITVRGHELARSPVAANKTRLIADAVHESDGHSTVTEISSLWCEICETSGHDILTCTNMFGPDGAKNAGETKMADEVVALKEVKLPNGDGSNHVAPLSPSKTRPTAEPARTKKLPSPMESGPVAGKESGIMDPEKWCAVCERDGHDSVDCPFEDVL